MQKFWLVWCEGGDASTYKHDTELSARTEAERLAKLNRGRTFHVMEVIASVKVTDVMWREYGGPEDCPF